MKIRAPLSGLIVPLHQVPDEAFAQKLVGDGISIEPTDQILYSPIDGEIDFIHPAGHALTIKAKDNLQVLIHIGIDTVQLKGEGFKALIKVGEQVKFGQPLVEFDLDFVATQARSLITQILITNAENYNFKFLVSANQMVIANDTFLFEVTELKAKSVLKEQNNSNLFIERQFICSLPTGLHARPAGALAQIAKKYNSEIILKKNQLSANAKSLVSILSIAVGPNDKFSISTSGNDAEEALDEITLLFDLKLHEEAELTIDKNKENLNVYTNRDIHDSFTGVVAAPGLVLGKVFQAQRKVVFVTENLNSNNQELEFKKLSAALYQTEVDLRTLVSRLKKNQNEDQVAIFEAHLQVLADPEIIARTHVKIKLGHSAEFAWQESVAEFKKNLADLKNEVMATRAHDLQDVGQRVIKHLLKIKDDSSGLEIPFTEPAILIARGLTPSDMVLIDPKKIKGICSVEGGASSHVAIIARSMGLAYLVAVSESVLSIKDGTEVVLNAKMGFLKLSISENERKEIQIEISSQKEKDLQNYKAANKKAQTLDGHHIKVFANVGKLKDAQDALEHGAEGIGLLRSEFLFLHRATAPTEDEQIKKYQDIVSALNVDTSSKTVIIRTLDVGGDKPLSYLPLPTEENPFLGVRGLRMSLRSTEIFRTQLRALLKTMPQTAVQIMFPMVTTLSELLDAKKILQEECLKLNHENVSVGIMIEVPSAALMADNLAPHVDFFSIGSNDLTQYTLAIDRGHRELASMADGLHPSVLKLIKITCDAASKHQKMVGVCGGIAGDALAIPLLVGLGVHELSVSVPVIPSVKAQIRQLDKKKCEALALEALRLSEASDVRKLVENLI